MPIMTSPISLISLVAVLALAACSLNGSPGKAPPPPGSTQKQAPDVTGTAVPAPEPLISAPPAPAGAPAAGGEWTQPEVSSERKQADTEDCYRYARAQVNNDIRIDDDIASARGVEFSQFARLTDLNKRVDSFYYEQQRGSRFESCMRSKGYAAQ